MKAKIIDGKLVYAVDENNYCQELSVSNPTDEMLTNAGFKEIVHQTGTASPHEEGTTIIIETAPEITPPQTNETIRAMRNEQYKLRSDSLYMAYQKYLALGEEIKAANAKSLWLGEIEMIDLEFPYIV